MDNLYDRIDFLSSDRTRLEVALTCRGQTLTRSRIARALEREPGSLSAIETLESHGALDRVGQAPARGSRPGGRLWTLSPEWEAAVEIAATRAAQGVLRHGLDLLLIPATDTQQAYDVLSDSDLSVSWGVPLQGERMGLLLCPSAVPNEAKTLEVMSVLGSRHIAPLRLHLPEIMSGGDLRRWARQITGKPDASLPSAG